MEAAGVRQLWSQARQARDGIQVETVRRGKVLVEYSEDELLDVESPADCECTVYAI